MWSQLKKPIIGLAPMDGVTDHPFRHIVKKYGQPDIVYTEFTSVEGLCHGAGALLKQLQYDESQRPIIAQIFGTNPDFFYQVAIMVGQLGFDGLDINMGCPAKNVAQSGAGAALINNPNLAAEIIAAAKAGINDYAQGKTIADCPQIKNKIAEFVYQQHKQLPATYQKPRRLGLSVKTRIGYDREIVDQWIPHLLAKKIDALALHGRTLKQGYSGQANWQAIARAAKYARTSQTIILGNGDVKSYKQAQQYIEKFQVDGILIGRASFGNPLVFQPPKTINQSLAAIAFEHARFFEQEYQRKWQINFLPMRKHLGWYIKNIPQAKEIRQQLFQTNSAQEVAAILQKYQLI